MLIRTKNGGFQTGDTSVLLDFLGVGKAAAGVQSNLGARFALAGDVELIASVPFHLMQENEAENGIAWTLSTFDLDRYGERIDPQGWDFKSYMNNPVVEWAHNYMIPAIGKIDSLAVDDKGLHGVVRFNSKDFDPFGWAIGERVKAGVIRAGSVGFRAIEIEIPNKENSKDGTSLIFRKQELLEFSICNVPANSYALAKANAELEKENTPGDFASSYWGGLINNFKG